MNKELEKAIKEAQKEGDYEKASWLRTLGSNFMLLKSKEWKRAR